MPTKIKQAPLWGRIGTGFGQGLASQIPKEIENYRHAQGLRELADSSQDLSPTQFLAKVGSTYGMTPQEIESFTKLAMQQQTKNAYGKRGQIAPGSSGAQPPQMNVTPKASPNINDIDFANLSQRNNALRQPQQQIQTQQQTPPVPPQAFGQPQIVNQSPIAESMLTQPQWTPEKRNERINDYINSGFTPDQSQVLAADDERRELQRPEAEQKRYAELEQAQEKAKSKLREKIETKTQKKGENLFEDISGEMMNNLERGMERDLRLNPKATVEDVTNDWSNRALQMAKTKNQLQGLSKQVGLTNIFSRGSTLSKLNEYSDVFKRAGNSEEYQNLLQKDFGLSPHGAASIAFPINDKVKKYTSSLGTKEGFKIINSDPRSIATQIENMIGPEDSILSILHHITDKYHGFDQLEFLNQLSEDKDYINLNERQRLELTRGIRENNPPGWADFYILGR